MPLFIVYELSSLVDETLKTRIRRWENANTKRHYPLPGAATSTAADKMSTPIEPEFDPTTVPLRFLSLCQ
jgi:hypothetical protein